MSSPSQGLGGTIDAGSPELRLGHAEGPRFCAGVSGLRPDDCRAERTRAPGDGTPRHPGATIPP